MSDENQLLPVEQQEIQFYGDTIQAVRMSDGTIYVAVRPICTNIGLAWQSQHRKLKNDPILSNQTMSITLMVTDINSESTRPHTTSMIGLRLEYVNGWLFKIDSRRVKEESRERLLQYQEKCYMVLAEAFNPASSRIGRLIELYRKAGRDPQWIQNRIRGISVRNELVGEWQERGIKDDEYGILTNDISTETFGLTTAEHKELKTLESPHVLRDHMNNIELILTALGEESTIQIAQADNAQGLGQNREAAREGGRVAGNARKELEERTGQSVISDDNFLPKQTQQKLLND